MELHMLLHDLAESAAPKSNVDTYPAAPKGRRIVRFAPGWRSAGPPRWRW